MSAYYQLIHREQQTDGRVVAQYQPLLPSQGAWNEHEQHMAAATGIICAELAQFQPRSDVRLGRLNLDIWGLIPLKIFSITTQVIRAGRTIELLEATMAVDGRTCIVARAWRMQTSDTSLIAGTEDRAIVSFNQMPDWNGMSVWGGGFIDSLQFKTDNLRKSGAGIVWMSNDLDMIEGQTTPDWVRLLGMVDTANGIVPRAKPHEWAFPNLDLNIDLLRLPQGKWLGLDTVQQYGSDGIGLTSSVLHDELGMFGRSEQILTLRQM